MGPAAAEKALALHFPDVQPLGASRATGSRRFIGAVDWVLLLTEGGWHTSLRATPFAEDKLSVTVAAARWRPRRALWSPLQQAGGLLLRDSKREMALEDGELPPTEAEFECTTAMVACLRTGLVATNGLPVCQAPGQATDGPRFARHRGKG